MTLQERYNATIDYFLTSRPIAETELAYSEPFELLVAVILSAQCTDKRVNIITPELFRAFPDAEKMSLADPSEVFSYIKSCTYPNNKAKHLVGMAKALVDEFNGKVPSEISDLMRIPGVGRKTANVIASVLFNKEVIAVDTHVFRVSKRIGLAPGAKTPLDVEMRLTKNIPGKYMNRAHHWLLLHGRYVCTARKPHCEECGLTAVCSYFTKRK